MIDGDFMWIERWENQSYSFLWKGKKDKHSEESKLVFLKK
jgi:hypothetical protein